nr:cytochrome P450 CYP82D47-like [Ipomoea batatas]
MVDLQPWFLNLIRNMSVRMIGGKRFTEDGVDCNKEEARRCNKVIKEFFYFFGVFVLSDSFPFLEWLDLQGHKKSMKIIAKELDNLVGGWLEEHKKRRISEEGKEAHDFMDVMLEILEDAQISDFDADTINKATCLNLLIAGSDAISVTLTWALSLLLNNRAMLDKVQEELDTQIGRDRNVDESDIKNLVFLQAVVKETLRLYPPGPVNGLRSSLQDCTLSQGYHVPAGTRLVINIWKIQSDESIWPEPNEFQPERFLTTHKDIDVRGQNFELIPFGSGRRSCPGIQLSLQTLHISLATLLHCFDFALPSNERIDMSESAGLINVKATPLKAICFRHDESSKCVSSILYQLAHGNPVTREKMERGNLPHLSPIFPVRSHPEESVIIAQKLRRGYSGTVAECLVVSGENLPRHFPTTYDQSFMAAQLYLHRRSMLVGHGAQDFIREFAAAEAVKVADNRPSAIGLWQTPAHPSPA